MEKPKSDGEVLRVDTGHKMRLTDVQGLRSLAIIGVLLFHLWPKSFLVGYLGVDIFFVISGYLMCMLMSRKLPLDCFKVSDFYFRRLKRIVPTYLFVIFIFLVGALIMICPIDYTDLLHETWKPLLFIANIPDSSNDDYFAQNMSKYSFFLHLWSLSVEVQFYLFVPLLIYLTQKISTQRRIFFVSSIALISFLIQITSSHDFEHMALLSRVWQFMYGFLAHYLSEGRVLDFQFYFYRFGNGKYGHLNKFLLIFNRALNMILTLCLITLIFVPFSDHKPLNRLLVIILTMLIIARPESNCVLSSSPVVFLGDISYSVYLVHWPLFEWYRYWDTEAFAYGGEFPVKSGAILIGASIVFGYVIEEIFKRVKIPNWRKLLEFSGCCYLMLALMLCSVNFYALNLMPRGDRLPLPSDVQNIIVEIDEVWQQHNNPRHLPVSRAIQYNGDFYRYSRGPTICRFRGHIPSEMKPHLIPRSYACIDIGAGTKNIVVIGNSHANSYYPGVQQMFKDVYKYLTMVFLNGCMLTGVDKTNKNYHLCKAHRDAMLPMLRQWRHPIDVIIVGQAYITHQDPAIVKNDPSFIEMQLFYGELAKIARELVFIPQVQLQSGVIPHLQTLQRRIYNEESLDIFRSSIEFQLQYKPNTRKRIAALKNEKFLIVNWEDLWCQKELGFCDTVDRRNKISYFFDQYHMNIYGSLLVGEYLRQLYDGWDAERQEKMQGEAVKRILFGKLMEQRKLNQVRK